MVDVAPMSADSFFYLFCVMLCVFYGSFPVILLPVFHPMWLKPWKGVHV